MALIELDHVEQPEPDGRPSDDVRIFGGDIDDVFIELYVQHVEYVRRTAQAQTPSHVDAEDITAEVFANLLLAMRNGRGPIDQPRAYLQACVRNEISRSRVRGGGDRLVSTDPDDIEAVVNGNDVVSAEDATAERETVTRAFSALSRRHRTILVATEVEGRSHADVGKQLRMSSPAVAALAKRAREAFAHAYLDEHLNPATGECRMVRRTLPAMIRGTVTPRRQRRVHDHLEQCPACAAAHDQLAHVNKVLRSLPTVALVGGATAGKTGWFASLKDLLGIGGGAPTGAGGGIAPVAVGASGFTAIPQVLSIATLTLGAMVVTGDTPSSRPDASGDAAVGAATDRGDRAPAVAEPLPIDAAPVPAAARDIPPSTVAVERDRVADADRSSSPHSRRDDDRGVGDAGAGAAASPSAGVGAASTVARRAPESQAPSTPRPATHAPADPSPTTAPRSGGESPSTTAPPPPPPPSTTPPPTTVLPSTPSPPRVEQITDAVDETVAGVTDVVADTADGLVTAGGQAVKDLGTAVDDILTGASLPALVGPVTEPLGQTVEQSGAVVRDVTDAVDGTVDGLTDVVDGLLGAQGLVDVDGVTDQLLGS